MIITISGLHGTGKSAVGKAIAVKLELKYYSTGEAFRETANDMNMSLEDFSYYVENHPEIDEKLDNKILDIGQEGDIVIDSQLSGHLLKEVADFKILLSCPLDTRVKRMADRDQTTYEEKLKETLLREKSERERFKILYNIDLGDNEKAITVYDIIINTADLTVEEVIEKIISEIKNYI